ncbi:MAG: carboxylating nicotinate-nucleotide diphosphorylase [Opitutaceae bacterium]|nr:carboxylating nicotinate-nucleotide diphosphorylase [Opitutaceae bacterium]
MSETPQVNRIDMLVRRLSWAELDTAYLRRLIELARDEDLEGLGLANRPSAAGDRSTDAVASAPREATAFLVARQPMTICGLNLVPLILSAYGGQVQFQPRYTDGKRAEKGAVLATLSGSPRVMLSAERVILNFLQRLSGISTLTTSYVNALGASRTRLLDTRKTTPGWRMLEKYAVGCGGGWNHRLGLFDRVMLKDNHLALLGSAGDLAAAVARARKAAPELPVEVEVDRVDQLAAVLGAGADVILLDNFSDEDLRVAVHRVAGRAFTEASGGITIESLPRLGNIGLDFISTGALVHKSTWVDIGLDWQT